MSQVSFSSSRRMSYLILRHFSSTQTQIIRIAILLAFFCVLETTGLHNNASAALSFGKVETVRGYDIGDELYEKRRIYYDHFSQLQLSKANRDRNGRNDGGGGGSISPYLFNPTHRNINSNRINVQEDRYEHYQDGLNFHRVNSYREHNHLNRPFLHPPPNSPNNNHHHQAENLTRQRCYVCLPPNKTSREAKEILAMFSKEDQSKIADCAEFDERDPKEYEFLCPPTYGGCILRIHGPNISRACSRNKYNECKKANTIEFCYCKEPLCNDIKQENTKLPNDDDDEDHTISGSGGGSTTPDGMEPPPPSGSGLVHQYTTTLDDEGDNSSAPFATFNLDKNRGVLDMSSLSNNAPLSFCPICINTFPLLSLLAPLSYLFS